MGDFGFCSICGNDIGEVHRCDPEFIKRLDKGRRSWERSNEPREQGHTFHERLSDGFTATAMGDPLEDR